MGKQTLHFWLGTYLGINYTRCCGVVLMHYNDLCMRLCAAWRINLVIIILKNRHGNERF